VQAVMGQVLASIDNTLAVATLMAHAEPIHREDTDLDTLLAIAIADMPASERGRIRVERSDAPHSVPVDMGLMRLALRNLLSNALKFSGAGAPVVVRLSEQESPQALVIDVTDSGPGIPPAEVAQLFQRGVRSAVPGDASNRGLGLGLYIVRRVMALHGGRAELAANTAAGVTMRLVVGPDPAD
jgi:two-component system, OmpR family, sensor kinase